MSCGCINHPWRTKTVDGDPFGCYCLCTAEEDACDHFPALAPGGEPSPSSEDHIRATAEAVGLDPNKAVEHWNRQMGRTA